MNQSLYRIVFNKARGCMMVVAEIASSNAKGKDKSQGARTSVSGSGSRSTRHSIALEETSTFGFSKPVIKAINSFVLLSMLIPSLTAPLGAYAQVISDPNALGHERPTILNTANGLPHVQSMKCGASIAFHRLNVGQSSSLLIESLATCHQCAFDLRRVSPTPIVSYSTQTSEWHRILCAKTLSGHLQRDPVSLDAMNVMHHLIFMLSSRYNRVRLKEYICEQLNVADMPLTPGYPSFESRPLAERHHLIQLMAWLMVDLEPRLRAAWRAKAIRYNLMFKDFTDAPEWYLKIVEGFSDWRGDKS